MAATLRWIGRHWRAILLVLALPLLLWLAALAGWGLLMLAGALWHGFWLLAAFVRAALPG
ncbi:hypothetical protein [Frigidibacter oleivorans]|uniref:hypothetical protein n=1 Tax=Frigidibacter oleivorans TaxID=2487129 RepID=UPI000F8E4B5D|nr:hypothetical protein [Frigidibacter oleivorans]